MTLCKLIKRVLDEQYGEVPAVDRDDAIKAELVRLTDVYRGLKGKDYVSVDYTQATSRFAYIFKYTVAHADFIRQLLDRSRKLEELFDRDHIMVSCLGGGPGSDFLGILKYMINNDKKATLTAHLFDKERSWADSWTDVAHHLDCDFSIYPNFSHLDVSDPATYANYRKFLKADLFTLSYFMSEVWKYKDSVEPFFDYCFAGAKPGAMFLYIDNRDSQFNGWFDSLCAKHNVTIQASFEGEMSFDNDEEKRDLGIYYDKFDWPKRKGSVGVRIGIKG